MSINFGFGYGIQSSGTFVGSYTGRHYIYGYAGAYPTGNLDYYGNRPVNIDSIALEGNWSATNGWHAEYNGDGNVYAVYNDSGGTGRLNFTRYLDNGGTVYSDTGDVWSSGGLRGTIGWSTVPSAPLDCNTQRTGRTVLVTTSGSSSDGGNAIGGYAAEDNDGTSGWVNHVAMAYSTGVAWHTWFDNLVPGRTYQFRVMAGNARGTSTQTYSGSITIPPLPTAPSLTLSRSVTSVTLTVGNTTSTDAPTYYVQSSTDNVNWTAAVSPSGSPRTYTYSGLTPGQTYFFRAYATSAVGQGAYSTQSLSIPTVPSAPSSVVGTRSGRSVAVAVGAPSSTGGDPILSYGIQYSNDGGNTWSASVTADANRQYTFNNLTTGTTYVFRAFATNDIGNSLTTSSAGVFISGYGKRYTQATVTGVSGDGTHMTFTAPGHGFSATDLVDVAGVTPSTLNVTQQQITSATTDTFTIAGTVTDAYTSGGTAQGFCMVLTGNRWNGTAWVPITQTQKNPDGSTWTSFN